MVKILWEIPWKGMRNALFYGQNAGNTMRNAIFYFISHSVMSLIYKILLCALWEHEKWKRKIVSSRILGLCFLCDMDWINWSIMFFLSKLFV